MKYLILLSLMLFGVTVKAQICKNCKVDTTGGYISIEDTVLHNPICNYELLTKAHLKLVHQLKISRTGIAFFPSKMNTLYKGSGESRGHVIPYEDLAWSISSATASMDLRRNLAPENQSQNIGSELASENYERSLADSLGYVKVYGGTYGTLGSMKGINKPLVYWKIIIEPTGDMLAFWMPLTGDKIAYQNLKDCLIPIDKLYANLGFNPVTTISNIKR